MTTQPVIQGYEILGQIADGGMSTVWKAKQLSLDRLVALKVLHEDLVKTERDVERFKTEARSAAVLRHNGLCEIYDAGEAEDGSVYYAMEYVAGFSIHQLLQRKGDLVEKQALVVAIGVAQVLKAIWDKNRVIHCDIKPDNILIDQDGTIRVTDLGLARVISRLSSNTDEGYIVGTPNYMSPEQAQGRDDLDFRTDIYALGATLYQMLTGMMPFADADSEIAAERQINDYIADPLALNPVVSNAAACLLEKMMVKDRTARYHSWDELIQDIEEVRAGRLPRGGLVPAGQSTVSRSTERELETQKMIDAMRPQRPQATAAAEDSSTMKSAAAKRPGASAASRNRGRSTTSKTGASKPRLRTSPTPQPRLPAIETVGQAAQKSFWLLLLVGSAYAGSFYYVHRHQQTQPEPVATTVADATPEPEPAIVEPQAATSIRSPAAPEVAPRPQQPVARPPQTTETVRQPAPQATSTSPRAWQHPDYLEALRLFENGQQRLQQYEQSGDQELLRTIEPDARLAIRLLRQISSDAPEEAQIPYYIQQSFQLINNTREAQILD